MELNRPHRTPAVVRAYDQGKVACMEGKPCSPPYDASVPQYEQWINGYHDETERRVKAGIKPLGGDGTLEDHVDDAIADAFSALEAEMNAELNPARPFN
jgi:hypothetical protein